MGEYFLNLAWRYYESNGIKLFLFYFRDRISNKLRKGYITGEWAKALELLLVEGIDNALNYLYEVFPQNDKNEVAEELLSLYRQIKDYCP
uniref:Uncharacterized protein n=1 Tax=candidate division WOR-3 bacterium TaxID=2052148 RepID=A0A7C2PAZ9_UNCW3